MARNFYLSNRPAPNTTRTPTGPLGPNATRPNNVIDLPVRVHLPTRGPTGAASRPRPFIQRHWLVQGALDLLALTVCVLFVCTTAVAIVAGGFLLFFAAY